MTRPPQLQRDRELVPLRRATGRPDASRNMATAIGVIEPEPASDIFQARPDSPLMARTMSAMPPRAVYGTKRSAGQ